MLTERLKEFGKPVYPSHAKAAQSVIWAADYFRDVLGYQVSDPRNVSANGPDLELFRDGRGFRVEVKRPYFSKRAWRVAGVSRTSDDYVAIVFRQGIVHVEAMPEYLKHCTADGVRSVTALAKIFGMEQAATK